MKKIERAALFLQQNAHLFCCPVCQADLFFDKNGLECSQKHRFDLSKKGTLYFILHGIKSEYDDANLWQARRQMLTHGLFDPLVTTLIKRMPKQPVRVLDIGCGEGSILHLIEQQRHQNDLLLGFDISKAAINLATQQPTQAFFCHADLAALPFKQQSFDVLIDMFTPSAYQEFQRVAKKDATLFKIVPNTNYLGELRKALYIDDLQKQNYSNQRVVDLFYQHYPKAKATQIKYQYPLDEASLVNLLTMTPLQWGAKAQNKANLLKTGLSEVTIDVTLLEAHF